MKIRTIKEAVAYVKEHDSGSRITENMIRGFAKQGKIPGLWSGDCFYVDVDQFFDALEQLSHMSEPALTPSVSLAPSPPCKIKSTQREAPRAPLMRAIGK